MSLSILIQYATITRKDSISELSLPWEGEDILLLVLLLDFIDSIDDCVDSEKESKKCSNICSYTFQLHSKFSMIPKLQGT